MKEDFDSNYEKFKKNYKYIDEFNNFVSNQKEEYEIILNKIRTSFERIDDENINNYEYNKDLIDIIIIIIVQKN